MKKVLFWVLSLLVTLFFAVFQRMTGPTHPLGGQASVDGVEISYKLLRSCETGEACPVLRSRAMDGLSGRVSWRRYRTSDQWASEAFSCAAGVCGAKIPSQPPAGKVEYYVKLDAPSAPVRLGDEPVVVRFRGPVPGHILLPHIILMFLFMLFSVRVALSAAFGLQPVPHSVPATVSFLVLGGFLFGPLTQYYAFGQAWTGFPFGHDLTDNKALLMLIFWSAALWATLRGRAARFWILAAFAVTAAVYFVPHSLLGSELNYDTGVVVTGK
ncbi:MAG: hypothetical protein COT18_11865 [Elusimicrobia bacterium CG08_land_8_20_14_0_20_59_10]|nr:MAG: hypothetical protein COT18_11865 [Elusimicrobia bacterium CG08_land_8_20_14_0_20_59_10]